MIQQLQISELGLVNKLAHQIWPVCYASILKKEQIEYMLQKFYSIDALTKLHQQHHKFIVLQHNNTAVVFASYEHHFQNSKKTKLHKLYIDPTMQKKGYGQMLINFVIMEAAVCGDTAVFLNVNRKNEALHFYNKNNFKILAEEDIDIGNGYFMNDYVMEKTL